jgi:hypothetical protein
MFAASAECLLNNTQYGHSIKMNQPTKQCLTIKHLIILVIFSVFKIAP